MSLNVDNLRDHYLSLKPYPFDESTRSMFSVEEIDFIRTYGNWFQAIWNRDVPQVTPKLKYFDASKAENFVGRTRIEDVWFRYKKPKSRSEVSSCFLRFQMARCLDTRGFLVHRNHQIVKMNLKPGTKQGHSADPSITVLRIILKQPPASSGR